MYICIYMYMYTHNRLTPGAASGIFASWACEDVGELDVDVEVKKERACKDIADSYFNLK